MTAELEEAKAERAELMKSTEMTKQMKEEYDSLGEYMIKSSMNTLNADLLKAVKYQRVKKYYFHKDDQVKQVTTELEKANAEIAKLTKRSTGVIEWKKGFLAHREAQ